MIPNELAAEIAMTVVLAQQRVITVGAEQYYVPGEPQRFEQMPLDDLLEYAEEEAFDLINYAVMARIRFARLRAALTDASTRPGAGSPLR